MAMPLTQRVLYLLLLSLLTTGCETSTTTDAVRLSGWVSSPSEERLLQQTLEMFQLKFPAIRVKYEPIPGNYSEKIQLMLGTYTAPDVFYLKGETAPSYMRYNILMPLNPFLEQDSTFDLQDFYPFLLQAFKKDSVYYGFPKDFNLYVLFYNKTMFRNAGLSRPPRTWQELVEFSKALTVDRNQDGLPEQWGLIIEPSIEMAMAFVYQNGGRFQKPSGELGITEPAFLQALEFYYRLYRQRIAALPTDVGAAWNGDAFGRSRCAMIFAGAWVIPFLQDNYPRLEYAVAPLPAGKQPGTVAFTNAYVMPKYCRQPEKAWTLMKYLTGKEGMAQWTSLGLALPARRSVAEKLGFYRHPIYKHFMQSTALARVFQVTYMERWYDDTQATIQAVFFKNTPLRQAFRDLARRLERYRLPRNEHTKKAYE